VIVAGTTTLDPELGLRLRTVSYIAELPRSGRAGSYQAVRDAGEWVELVDSVRYGDGRFDYTEFWILREEQRTLVEVWGVGYPAPSRTRLFAPTSGGPLLELTHFEETFLGGVRVG
jgi:hypothetical protein